MRFKHTEIWNYHIDTYLLYSHSLPVIFYLNTVNNEHFIFISYLSQAGDISMKSQKCIWDYSFGIKNYYGFLIMLGMPVNIGEKTILQIMIYLFLEPDNHLTWQTEVIFDGFKF